MKCPRCRREVERAETGRPRRYCTDACRQAAYRRRQRRRHPLFSSRSEEWATPQHIFEALNGEFGPFDLDPAATTENAKCRSYFTREQDGLAQEWTGRVFVNPPYGREISQWMQKAWKASQTTADIVVCLVHARTDTAWWHDYAQRGETRFLRGRLKFGPRITSAPFPSAIVVFRNGNSRNETADGQSAELGEVTTF